MAMYNLTQLQAATTVSETILFGNDVTSGLLTGLLMIAVWFIMILFLKRWDFDVGAVATGYVCFILSLFLTYAGMLNFIFPLIFLAIAAFSTLFIYMTRN